MLFQLIPEFIVQPVAADLVDTTDKTVDALMKLDLPAGVDVKIKVQ